MALSSQLILIFFLVCCSAFFSSSETALFSLSRLRLKRQHENNPVDTWFVNRLLENPRSLVRIILIGNEVTNISISVVVAAFCFRFFKNDVPQWAIPLVPIVFATPLLLVFGEILPKALAIKAPEMLSRFNAPWLLVFSFIIKPLQWSVGRFVSWFLRLFGFPVGIKMGDDSNIDEDTFRSMLDLGYSEGEVKTSERDLIHRVLELDDTTVTQLMTKRQDVFAVDIETPLKELLQEVRYKKLSRIPVFRRESGRVIGMLYAKDLLHLWKDAKRNLSKLLRPAYFVPQQRKVSEVLRDFQEYHIHIGVVSDDHDEFIGLITMQDILDHLFPEAFFDAENEEAAAEEALS